MEKKEIIVDKPVEIAGMTIIPVVCVTTNCFSKKNGIASYCEKKPLFVVIVTASYKKAFNINGAEVPLEELIEAVPDLKGMI